MIESTEKYFKQMDLLVSESKKHMHSATLQYWLVKNQWQLSTQQFKTNHVNQVSARGDNRLAFYALFRNCIF